MKKLIVSVLLATLAFATFADVVDVYDLKMSVRVPRVYDNTCSQGYRKYQTQTIKGYLYVTYDEEDNVTLEIKGLVNKTHKINGVNVSYECTVDNEGQYVYPRWNYIGDNAKEKFQTPSVCFYVDAEPSYNLGEDEPDNSLLITLSGTGSTGEKKYTVCNYCCGGSNKTTFKYRMVKSLNGRLAGTLGCGCKSYNHKSPTRKIGAFGATEEVDDVAAVDGTWSATYNSKLSSGR